MKKKNLLKMLLAVSLVCTSVAFGADILKGNKNSKIYHNSSCKHHAAKSSTVEFQTESEAQQAGFKACKLCGKAESANAEK